MNQKMAQILEGLLSVVIVASLYVVGVYVQPKERKIELNFPVVELRDRFYGITTVTDKPNIVWMVGKEGKILRSENGGGDWKPQNSGTRENLQSIAAWDSMHAVAVGNAGMVLITADGGDNWKKIDAPKSSVDNKLIRVRIDPSNGVAWAVGIMGTILSSTDHGATWQREIDERDIAWNDIGFAKSGDIWVVGEFGHVLRKSASGKNDMQKTTLKSSEMMSGGEWTEVKVPTDRSLMTIKFSDLQYGVIAGVEGTLLATNNDGASWNQVSVASREHILDMTLIDSHWIGIGGRGLLMRARVGDENQWEVGRIKENGYAWHTAVVPVESKLIFAGANLLMEDFKALKLYK